MAGASVRRTGFRAWRRLRVAVIPAGAFARTGPVDRLDAVGVGSFSGHRVVGVGGRRAVPVSATSSSKCPSVSVSRFRRRIT